MTAGTSGGAGAPGGTVYRVVWVPGTDRLRGECHCGAEREAEDPVAVWAWLLAHPEGHDGGGGQGAPVAATPDAWRAESPAVPIGV